MPWHVLLRLRACLSQVSLLFVCKRASEIYVQYTTKMHVVFPMHYPTKDTGKRPLAMDTCDVGQARVHPVLRAKEHNKILAM